MDPLKAVRDGEQLSPTACVATEKIRKVYGGVAVVDDVSVAFRAGEVTGLVGKNGAGKSTLIKMLAGAVRSDGGVIRLNGQPVTFHTPRDATKHGLGFVHQELQLIPQLTVAENVEMGLGFPKRMGLLVSERSLRNNARKTLQRLGVSLDPRAVVSSLSVAEQKIVMIARALARKADIIVLDEPTAALTDSEIRHLHAVIASTSQAGTGFIYVTHRLQEVFDISQRVVVMRDGRLVADELTGSLSMEQLISHISAKARDAVDLPAAAEPPSENGKHLHDRGDVVVEMSGLPGPISQVGFRSSEVVGIVGLVGSGRSRLARLLVGSQRDDTVVIRVHGQEVKLSSPRAALDRGIVLLPEERASQGLIPDMSVTRNTTLASLRNYREHRWFPVPSRRAERRAATEFIHRLGVRPGSPEMTVTNLSGGNQQKVVLAKWLARNADVLIFDEPTHGVDVDGKEDVYREIRELAGRGKTVLFISSEFPELVGNCDRFIVMREGQIIAELPADRVPDESVLVELCYGHQR